MLKTTLTVVTALVLSVGLGFAAPIDCTQPAGVLDVTSMNPDGCFLGGNVYDMWEVGGTNPQTVGLSNLTGVDGSVQNLRFTLSPQFPSGGSDTTLRYRVTGGILGIDLGVTNASGETTINENVCTVNFCGEPGSVLVTTLGPIGVAGFGEIMFPGESMVYISKDINVPDGSSISDFRNSHHVPEPTTLLLMGTGLFALGFGRRYLTRGK